MLIIEYYLPNGNVFYVDKVTGYVPDVGVKIVDPFTQQAREVTAQPEYWVARQTVKIKVS